MARRARVVKQKGGLPARNAEVVHLSEIPTAIASPRPSPEPTTKSNGVSSSMNHGTSADRALLREAFDVLLELRSRPHAGRLLSQAVSYLRLLGNQEESQGLPLVISVQMMRLPKV